MRRFWFIVLLGLAFCAPARAANYSIFCDQEPRLTAEQKNRLFLFADNIKHILDASGHSMALVARAGIDLDRFNLRYSHSGISLKESGNTPWSVRQLYYSCEQDKPMLFDQGLTGFLIDQDNKRLPFVSLVFLPAPLEQDVERAALDKPLALKLLAAEYSANAYAFSTRYQNCNQWVMEILAHAEGWLPAGGDLREDAQRWLQEQHYQPTQVQVNNPFIILGGMMMPLLHTLDHPPENRSKGLFEVTMPASEDAFVQTSVPGATRVEMCMNGEQIVVHHGWDLIPDGCQAGPGDSVIPLS
ncbi:DUF2145 domain-containing protein [Paludibacterium yongneupense]|uniref:DUF2145 domain-containing protein n=1 Tax=Paludibacterium yongneupense TaxID=400061 RepID=UPI0003F7E771|nr:DUF2145 domain-containing protein [Paludibacterium yongneupense]